MAEGAHGLKMHYLTLSGDWAMTQGPTQLRIYSQTDFSHVWGSAPAGIHQRCGVLHQSQEPVGSSLSLYLQITAEQMGL